MRKCVHLTVDSLVPSLIRDYSNIVTSVVAAAMDENREEIFPGSETRSAWNRRTVRTR